MTETKEINTVAIVGARGRMGRLFAGRCERAGIKVRPIDRPYPGTAELKKLLDGVHMLFLCVPTGAMAEVIARFKDALEPTVILSEMCSVKERPLRDMLKGYDGPVVGTHPLFGPEPGNDTELRVALVRGRDDAAADAVYRWIKRLGFIPFETTAEEHDKAMAMIQGLNFVTTVSYLSTLARREDLTKFLTPSFHRRLDAAKKMITEDSEMFSGIFEANPHSQEAVRAFRRYLNLAAGGDVELLADRAAWWWRDDDKTGGPKP